MTLIEFNALDEAEQHEAIFWEHGVHVGEREEGEYRIILYQIFSFYVEAYYHMEHNVVKRLRSFSSTECLDAYIKKFDLSDINYLDNNRSHLS